MCCESPLVDVVVSFEEVEVETDEVCVVEVSESVVEVVVELLVEVVVELFVKVVEVLSVNVVCDPWVEVVEEVSTVKDRVGLELVLVVDSVIAEEEVVLTLDETESDETLVDEVVVDNVKVAVVDSSDVLDEVPDEEACVELELVLVVGSESTEEVVLDDEDDRVEL